MELNLIKESGLLELYILGTLDLDDIRLVEDALPTSPELVSELRTIEATLEIMAFLNQEKADTLIKSEVLTQVNFLERMDKGEASSYPPALHPASEIGDYSFWLQRKDLQLPSELENVAGRIIGSTDKRTTMILWVKKGIPTEKHTKEIESFLIVEGSCNIIIGERSHSIASGDYFTIPLHVTHRIEVTSDQPCKAIYERLSA